MTDYSNDRFANRYVGCKWKDLEFEEQAHVRELKRKGILAIDSERNVVWTLKSLTHPFN